MSLFFEEDVMRMVYDIGGTTMKITRIVLVVISLALVTFVGVFFIANKRVENVVLDGKSIQIPCEFSELLNLYEISEYSKNELKKPIAKGESKTIFLAKNDVENGISVEVYNNHKKVTSDIGSCEVRMISIDESTDAEVEVFGGLAPGMTALEVEKVLEGTDYNKSEMSGYVFYHATAGKKSAYYMSLVLYEDRVMNVSLYYTNEEN